VPTQFLRYFTPSVLRFSPEARQELAEAADLAERAAMRRIWEVGASSYQVVAARVRASADSADVADLLVRRRYTLEPGSVIVRGSVRDALKRALSCLRRMREAETMAALLSEYNVRGPNAGLAPASTLVQCFVLAPASVYAAAAREADAIGALRAELEPGELGFRFFAGEGGTDDFRVTTAVPFATLDLIRPVAAIHK